jgi:hypothetical protein
LNGLPRRRQPVSALGLAHTCPGQGRRPPRQPLLALEVARPRQPKVARHRRQPLRDLSSRQPLFLLKFVRPCPGRQSGQLLSQRHGCPKRQLLVVFVTLPCGQCRNIDGSRRRRGTHHLWHRSSTLRHKQRTQSIVRPG